MIESELLERLDEHIAASNDHMARGNELMDRVIELHEDQRVFMRDLTRRNEIAARERVRTIRDQRRELLAQRTVLLDVHEESKAQSQGIGVLIDELRSHGLGGKG